MTLNASCGWHQSFADSQTKRLLFCLPNAPQKYRGCRTVVAYRGCLPSRLLGVRWAQLAAAALEQLLLQEHVGSGGSLRGILLARRSLLR